MQPGSHSTAMKYRELGIRTRREEPARARSKGISLLIRAGYLAAEGDPTPLGVRAITHLRELAQSSADLFEAIHLPTIATADGEIVVQQPSGDRRLLRCPTCGYAAAPDTAKFGRRRAASEATLPLKKVATPNCNTIEALTGFLGIDSDRTAKALMYQRDSDGKFVFVVVRGDTQISDRKLKNLLGELKPAAFQEIAAAGAVPGYASPIGVRNALVVVDELVPRSFNLVAGANQLGYHLENTNYGRDYQADLVADLATATEGDACPNCGASLTAFSASVVADRGGVKFEKVLVALAEAFNDEQGLCIPSPAAPYEVYLMHLPSARIDTLTEAEQLYQSLSAAGESVLFDDRDERAGVKFKDADLIGCPIRITVGERNIGDRMVEFKLRKGAPTYLVRIDEAASAIRPSSLTSS